MPDTVTHQEHLLGCNYCTEFEYYNSYSVCILCALMCILIYNNY